MGDRDNNFHSRKPRKEQMAEGMRFVSRKIEETTRESFKKFVKNYNGQDARQVI
jgi:hypothetical protein